KTSVPPNLSDSSILAFSLSKADHVGIYLGDDIFIHAASTGAKTGVIRSSLKERSWQQRFLFAGRALPASGFSGFALDWGSGISFAQLDMLLQGDLLAFVRGISGWTEVSLPVANNLSAGLRAGVQWDRVLGVVRVPIEIDLGRISGVSVFAGPAITFGLPTLNGRLYTQGDFFLATGGLRWSSFFYSRGAHRLGSYIELRYDYYVPKPEQVESIRSDLQSCLNISIGFRLRNVFY
ncbi:MAG TPA: NlpC/P60 family protein, partial [Rectinema sp.]|nr:NlpC/P60 family protein [Rectinema sp.]